MTSHHTLRPERGDRADQKFRDGTFGAWERKFHEFNRILDLGSGEHGGYPINTRARVLRIDIWPRHRPDMVADAQTLPFRDESFDGVLAMSILEHVPRPWVVVAEIRRTLLPGGLVLGYVPYMFPYHADESFRDYYRFSDEALTHLFGHFSEINLLTAGGYTNAMLRFVAGFTASQRHLLRVEKSLGRFLAQLAKMTGTWDSTRVRGLRRSPTGFNFLARK